MIIVAVLLVVDRLGRFGAPSLSGNIAVAVPVDPDRSLTDLGMLDPHLVAGIRVAATEPLDYSCLLATAELGVAP